MCLCYKQDSNFTKPQYIIYKKLSQDSQSALAICYMHASRFTKQCDTLIWRGIMLLHQVHSHSTAVDFLFRLKSLIREGYRNLKISIAMVTTVTTFFIYRHHNSDILHIFFLWIANPSFTSGISKIYTLFGIRYIRY